MGPELFGFIRPEKNPYLVGPEEAPAWSATRNKSATSSGFPAGEIGQGVNKAIEPNLAEPVVRFV